MKTRLKWGTIWLASMLILAGCTGNIAAGVSDDDLIGSWSVGGGFDTKLDLLADGTVESDQWPAALGCDDSAPSNVADLRASERRKLAGKWQSYGGSLSYQVSLTFAPGECTQGGAFAFVWRAADGELALCVKIPRDAPLESLREHQYFVLNAGTSFATMRSNACV